MYILFINSGGKYDIIFLLNLIIIIKKNCPTHGLDLCNELGWVELNFFFLPIMVGWVKKSPHLDPCTLLLIGV